MIPDILTVLLHLISKTGCDEIMLLHVKQRSTTGACSEAPSLDVMHFSIDASSNSKRKLIFCLEGHNAPSYSWFTV